MSLEDQITALQEENRRLQAENQRLKGNLGTYLKLEELVARYEQEYAYSPAVGVLRDSMDALWYALSAAEHQWLDERETASG
jgi:regulator of replication initiation timing